METLAVPLKNYRIYLACYVNIRFSSGICKNLFRGFGLFLLKDYQVATYLFWSKLKFYWVLLTRPLTRLCICDSKRLRIWCYFFNGNNISTRSLAISILPTWQGHAMVCIGVSIPPSQKDHTCCLSKPPPFKSAYSPPAPC